MPRYLSQDYRAWLTHGSTYKFVLCEDGERVVTVTARRSQAGAVWLLYEHVGDTLDLRYWVMPNGGLSEAREMGPNQAVLLRILPSVANVRDLEDVTDEQGASLADRRDLDVRRQINDLLGDIDWGDDKYSG